MGIDMGHFQEPVGVKDAQPPIVKLNNPVLAKAMQNAIDVNPGEPGRVTKMLLGHGKMHFFGAMGRPLHAVPNKELKQ